MVIIVLSNFKFRNKLHHMGLIFMESSISIRLYRQKIYVKPSAFHHMHLKKSPARF